MRQSSKERSAVTKQLGALFFSGLSNLWAHHAIQARSLALPSWLECKLVCGRLSLTCRLGARSLNAHTCCTAHPNRILRCGTSLGRRLDLSSSRLTRSSPVVGAIRRVRLPTSAFPYTYQCGPCDIRGIVKAYAFRRRRRGAAASVSLTVCRAASCRPESTLVFALALRLSAV